MPSASDLDAVTVDAFGTIVELADPVPALRRALSEHGVERSQEAVSRAFREEVAYYLPRAPEGRDPESLLALRRACAGVFLAAADAQLDPVRFEPDFVGSLSFSALPGTAESLDALRAAGLALACVANWDSSLAGFLEDAGVADRFDAIVSAAEAGALKPDPRVFELALDRLGVLPSRALHIGDDAADRDGASAAGLAFEPVPLATLPARLGLAPP